MVRAVVEDRPVGILDRQAHQHTRFSRRQQQVAAVGRTRHSLTFIQPAEGMTW